MGELVDSPHAKTQQQNNKIGKGTMTHDIKKKKPQKRGLKMAA